LYELITLFFVVLLFIRNFALKAEESLFLLQKIRSDIANFVLTDSKIYFTSHFNGIKNENYGASR